MRRNDDQGGKDSMDAVIAVYKNNIDRAVLRENLKLSVEERLRKFERLMEEAAERERTGQEPREK